MIANRGDATLELHWSVQPWVGILTWKPKQNFGAWKTMKGGVSRTFTFPEVIGKKPADMNVAKGGEKNRGKPA